MFLNQETFDKVRNLTRAGAQHERVIYSGATNEGVRFALRSDTPRESGFILVVNENFEIVRVQRIWRAVFDFATRRSFSENLPLTREG